MPSQVTGPTLVKVAGTGNATPDRKISSLPLTGTVVTQVCEAESNVVVAQVAVAENMTMAFGTGMLYGTPLAVKLMFPLRKYSRVPAAGTPLAEKLALNQM